MARNSFGKSKTQFDSEGVSGLNYASIINTLVRTGLGFEYEPGHRA